MAFTIQDFHDLVELLAQHPEWRAELRRHVLSEELIELPALVRQLVEAQARTEGRLDRMEAALERLGEAQARTEATIRELAAAQARTEARLDRLTDRVGEMDGRLLELDFGRTGPARLSPIARRLRLLESGPLADMLDDAVDDGRLSADERRAILRADAVLSGRRRSDGQDMYLVVEISGGIRMYDVERAVTRAKLLEKLGRPALPVVAGRRIHDDAAELARNLGVWVAQDGDTTDSPDA